MSSTPEVLEVEASFGAGHGAPPSHLHPAQDEHFEVLEGKVKTVIDDVEGGYGEGDQFDVPAGTVHQMAGDGPARVLWQVRPALRSAEFFERLYDALDNGFPEGQSFETFLAEFSDEFRLA